MSLEVKKLRPKPVFDLGPVGPMQGGATDGQIYPNIDVS